MSENVIQQKEITENTETKANYKIKGKKRLGNKREIILSLYLFVAVFLGMIGYLTYFVATSEQDMINNSYNSRQQILLSRNFRGTILSRDGEVLAETIMDDEENEKRVYPFENLFSHVVGYSTNGRMGVEALANYYLNKSDPAYGPVQIAYDMGNIEFWQSIANFIDLSAEGVLTAQVTANGTYTNNQINIYVPAN